MGRLSPLPDWLAFFGERARAVQPQFKFSASNVADVARICAWLDGLPLAIEMAAVQVKWLPTNQLYEQLSNRLALLTGGPRDLSPRQQSLAGAIGTGTHGTGPTLGKRRVHIMGVCAETGQLPSGRRASLRYIVPVVLIIGLPGSLGLMIALLFGVSWLLIDTRIGLMDRLARTRVVVAPHPALNVPQVSLLP